MADTTPTPSPQRVGLFDFLENHLDYRVKLATALVILGIIVAAGVIGFNYVRDMRAELTAEKEKTATLSQKFQPIGPAAVTGNQVQTPAQANQQAKDALGPAVIDAMSKQNASLLQLTQALAQVQSRVSQIENLNPQAFQQHQDQKTGALTGFTLDEARRDPTGKSLPGLASVNLFYDPAQKDPNAAFKGTSWTHNREDFKVATGEWKKKADGGFMTAISLTRTVYKPDGTLIGPEDIPVADGSTAYTPQGLTPAPAQAGRWTALLGAAKGSAGGYRPAGMVNYNLTQKWGVWAGVTAGGGTAPGLAGQSQSTSGLFGISIRFGAPK